ncbi:hypothetical protein [Fumia xinanensis]|uniref:Uncharacterized protein n=1 Tax=Fumia xinanensis TaxID=2763659 RepID=A0A926E155_9FIRM|nr:hypothetical protein [Fumia xinanensis]MBC8559699.1 hypothetical protein [Fumia xinanensis]PWL45605.1 MAG: hypothetical protein DBY45_03775 [Clostridiales bacterium]
MKKTEKISLFPKKEPKGRAGGPDRGMKKPLVSGKNGFDFIDFPQNGRVQNGGAGFFSSYAEEGLFETDFWEKTRKDRL